jgi:hypothetical protein
MNNIDCLFSLINPDLIYNTNPFFSCISGKLAILDIGFDKLLSEISLGLSVLSIIITIFIYFKPNALERENNQIITKLEKVSKYNSSVGEFLTRQYFNHFFGFNRRSHSSLDWISKKVNDIVKITNNFQVEIEDSNISTQKIKQRIVLIDDIIESFYHQLNDYRENIIDYPKYLRLLNNLKTDCDGIKFGSLS